MLRNWPSLRAAPRIRERDFTIRRIFASVSTTEGFDVVDPDRRFSSPPTLPKLTPAANSCSDPDKVTICLSRKLDRITYGHTAGNVLRESLVLLRPAQTGQARKEHGSYGGHTRIEVTADTALS